MTKKIAIIIGHPNAESFCHSLAANYAKGAERSGAQVTILDLAEMHFDPILHNGYNKRTELEEDLLHAQRVLLEADHTVWIYPIWWATMPAVLKGFLDRVLLPGFAFKYTKGKAVPEKLLLGRSARIIATMDSPVWYYRAVLRNSGIYAMKKGVLEFSGIRPVATTRLGSIGSSTPDKLQRMLELAEHLGQQQK
ncbi:Putative NADPH-quinone reductase (modulator of drug activity B) [Paenibacillaceae bacterium GAS479]|nr:Putative NADPH-quinone reductase (modulator of drug activity B) [Paenibacillaceae bacterium GAS479]